MSLQDIFISNDNKLHVTPYMNDIFAHEFNWATKIWRQNK